MGELLRRLGKFIQGLFKKNQKPEYESVYSIFGAVDTDTLTFSKIDDKGFVEIPSGPERTSAPILNDGVLYIDGQPFGTVKSLSWESDIDEGYKEMEKQLDKLRDELLQADWPKISKNIEEELNCYNSAWGKNELEKFVNISRTILPKRIPVKTLILTLAANQEYDYQAVDISLLEEKGIVHDIIGSTKSPEELDAQYQTSKYWDEESDGPLWFDDGTCSAVVGAATLLYYEELGIWEVDYD